MGLQNAVMRLFTRVHVSIYRRSKGKIMGTIAGMPVLVLHTVGRNSGKERKTPLTYFTYENSYVIIASNGGSDRHPAWFFNLKSVSNTQIEVSGRTVPVLVKIVSAEDKRRLWKLLVAKASAYEKYQQKTTRDIPMILLSPLSPSSELNTS